MNVWNNCYFPASDVPTKDHDATPSEAICLNCGWMFCEHIKDSVTSHWRTRFIWCCPSGVRFHKHTRIEQWSWANEQQQYLLEIKDLKNRLFEATQNATRLSNAISQDAFRINNLLDQQSQSTQRACEQDKKIKELEIRLQERINVEATRKCKQSHSSHVTSEELCNMYYDLLNDRGEWERQNTDCRMALQRKQEKLDKVQKELEDTLKSKTISVHNYYQSPPKWEFITSAPRDGSTILIWRPCVGTPFVISAYFSIEQRNWIDVNTGSSIIEPQFWMPLPQPPRS